MFTKEYVEVILSPFVGKKLRMRNDKNVPFFLETSMESSFQIEFQSYGIQFLLIDNFYIERDLDKAFSEAFRELEIFPLRLDSLLKEKPEKTELNVVYGKLLNSMKKNFKPQIAFTYWKMIKSLRVEETRFFINDVEFFVTNH